MKKEIPWTNMLEHSILEQVIKTNEELNKRIVR